MFLFSFQDMNVEEVLALLQKCIDEVSSRDLLKI